MTRPASHAEHVLAVLHDGFIAESMETLDLLSVPEQVYLIIWRLEMEVYNGGMQQFFSNSSGAFVPRLANALQAINAGHVWPIIEHAAALAGPDVPWSDDAKRFRVIKNLSSDAREHIWALDKQLGEHLEELSVLLFNYVVRNREPFRMPEEFWKKAVSHDPR